MCNPSSTGGPSGELKQAIEAEASPDPTLLPHRGRQVMCSTLLWAAPYEVAAAPPANVGASCPNFPPPNAHPPTGPLQFGSVQAMMEKFDAAAAGECGDAASAASSSVPGAFLHDGPVECWVALPQAHAQPLPSVSETPGVFGSGWAWLVVGQDGKLSVTSTANQVRGRKGRSRAGCGLAGGATLTQTAVHNLFPCRTIHSC